jgi:hypothetical protein
MILIVSYDLKDVRDYSQLYEMLKRQGTNSWWHYLSSTWLLSTSRTPQEVFEAIKPYLGPQDFVLVGEFNQSNYYGWLPQEAWDWIAAQRQPMLPNLAALSALAGKVPPSHA